jgi:hypothetical protein
MAKEEEEEQRPFGIEEIRLRSPLTANILETYEDNHPLLLDPSHRAYLASLVLERLHRLHRPPSNPLLASSITQAVKQAMLEKGRAKQKANWEDPAFRRRMLASNPACADDGTEEKEGWRKKKDEGFRKAVEEGRVPHLLEDGTEGKDRWSKAQKEGAAHLAEEGSEKKDKWLKARNEGANAARPAQLLRDAERREERHAKLKANSAVIKTFKSSEGSAEKVWEKRDKQTKLKGQSGTLALFCRLDLIPLGGTSPRSEKGRTNADKKAQAIKEAQRLYNSYVARQV